MILVLFGQPGSGKTTISKMLFLNSSDLFIPIDGDELRDIFVDTDFSRSGRINNLNRASNIAVFLAKREPFKIPVLSLVYPYAEARKKLNSMYQDIVWVYLTNSDIRGKESFHVKDFEIPGDDERVLELDTTKLSVKKCMKKIYDEIYEKDNIENG